jgi:hypothetical protein
MITYIIWAIVLYCVYKIVFNFLVPVIRVSRRMRSQVRDFQRQANGQFQNYQKDNTRASQPSPAEKGGEYIDFEEIKEK